MCMHAGMAPSTFAQAGPDAATSRDPSSSDASTNLLNEGSSERTAQQAQQERDVHSAILLYALAEHTVTQHLPKSSEVVAASSGTELCTLRHGVSQ